MCSYPTRNKNSKNIVKKFKKLENTIIASFQAKIGYKRLRKREKKKIVLMYSHPTRNRKFQKNSKKIKKKLENPIIASFQAKIGGKRPGNRDNKKNRFNVCLPDP